MMNRLFFLIAVQRPKVQRVTRKWLYHIAQQQPHSTHPVFAGARKNRQNHHFNSLMFHYIFPHNVDCVVLDILQMDMWFLAFDSI